MIGHVLADGVVLVHVGFVLFVALGGFLALRWRRTAWVHLPCALWGILIEFTNWTCPLTPLEDWLRRRGEDAAHDGGFIGHYLLPLLYSGAYTPRVQSALGCLALGVNLLAYGLVAARSFARPARTHGGRARDHERPDRRLNL